MSHHVHGYRIYPDDETDHSNEQWSMADRWINGLEFRRDYNEAMALAKVGGVKGVFRQPSCKCQHCSKDMDLFNNHINPPKKSKTKEWKAYKQQLTAQK